MKVNRMNNYKKLHDRVLEKYTEINYDLRIHLFTKEELKKARQRALYWKKKGIGCYY